MTIIRTFSYAFLVTLYANSATCSDPIDDQSPALDHFQAVVEDVPEAKPAQPILKRLSGVVTQEEPAPEVVVEELPVDPQEARRSKEMEGLRLLQDQLFKSAGTPSLTPASRQEARQAFRLYAVVGEGEELDSVDSMESAESVESSFTKESVE